MLESKLVFKMIRRDLLKNEIKSGAPRVRPYPDNSATCERKRPEGFSAAKKLQKNKCNSKMGPSSIPSRQPTWQLHSHHFGFRAWKGREVKGYGELVPVHLTEAADAKHAPEDLLHWEPKWELY